MEGAVKCLPVGLYEACLKVGRKPKAGDVKMVYPTKISGAGMVWFSYIFCLATYGPTTFCLGSFDLVLGEGLVSLGVLFGGEMTKLIIDGG